MSLTLSLAPDRQTLVARSPHGLAVALPKDLSRVGPELLRLLRKQAEPKPPPTRLPLGIGPESAALILADWERIGPEGAGKRPVERDERGRRLAPTPRTFTESGRELEPLL